MEFESVKSSYIKRVGYDPERQKMAVEFKNGAIWVYEGVPQSAHVSLMLAESIGSFFAHEIKGVFDGYKQQTQPEE